MAEIDALSGDVRQLVYGLLDDLDVLHRSALHRFAEAVGTPAVDAARSDPAVDWLLEAYGVAAAPDSEPEPPRAPVPTPVQVRPTRITS